MHISHIRLTSHLAHMCSPYLANPPALLLVLVARHIPPLQPATVISVPQKVCWSQKCVKVKSTLGSPFRHFDVGRIAGGFAVVVEQEIHKLCFQATIFQSNPQVPGNSDSVIDLMSLTLAPADVHLSEEERLLYERVCAPIPFQSCRGSPRCTPPKLTRGPLSGSSPSLGGRGIVPCENPMTPMTLPYETPMEPSHVRLP